MANLKDIQFTYDDLDQIIKMALNTKYPDFTNALYKRNFTLSLEDAQKAKHKWVIKNINFKPEMKIFDIGCGWGNMLNVIRKKGGQGIGITLSPAQTKSCQKNGLNAILKDWKNIDTKKFEKFDAIISIGAFEHFCSIEEYLKGKQDKIYRDFFKLCYQLLAKKGSRLYLQTMLWGSNAPWGEKRPGKKDIEENVRLDAPKLSDQRTLALVRAFFPGSWLPLSKNQIINIAKPYFKLVKSSNGREDYIQTIKEWLKAWYKPSFTRTVTIIKLLPRYLLGGKSNRAWLQSIRESAMMHVFARKIFDHERMFFKKI